MGSSDRGGDERMSNRVSIVPGNTVRCTVTFVPETGTVSLADVSARCVDGATQTVHVLDPVEDSTNVFHADLTVPDDVAVGGTWRFRFESNTPSPHISLEGDDMAFEVAASRMPTP